MMLCDQSSQCIAQMKEKSRYCVVWHLNTFKCYSLVSAVSSVQ